MLVCSGRSTSEVAHRGAVTHGDCKHLEAYTVAGQCVLPAGTYTNVAPEMGGQMQLRVHDHSEALDMLVPEHELARTTDL